MATGTTSAISPCRRRAATASAADAGLVCDPSQRLVHEPVAARGPQGGDSGRTARTHRPAQDCECIDAAAFEVEMGRRPPRRGRGRG